MSANLNFTEYNNNNDPSSFPDSKVTTTEESIVLPRAREQLLRAVKYLDDLEDDWDGCGSLSPSKATIDTATKFIDAYAWFVHQAPDRIMPDIDRSISMKWHFHDGSFFMLNIDGLNLALMKFLSNGDVQDIAHADFLPAQIHIPSCIREALPSKS